MHCLLKLLLITIITFFQVTFSLAQETWPSPEMEQMYRHGQEYMSLGNYSDAIVTFKQLSSLAPGKILVITELGDAYFLSGDYDNAIDQLATVVSRKDVGEKAFQVLSASQAALGHFKEAKKTIGDGLEHFPKSGLLYYQEGLNCIAHKDRLAALTAWLDGIDTAPQYNLNYNEAAKMYLTSSSELWGLLYGETYLAMQHDTTGDNELKELLFAGWKTFFDHLADAKPNKNGTPFETAVIETFRLLTPVVSDGITTENLVMVRTRFLMAWFTKYDKQFNFPLFDWQDDLVRNGWFDIYNEWLFGKAESAVQHAAWLQFHTDELPKWEDWHSIHLFLPSSMQGYNDRNETVLNNIASQKKKR